MEHKTILLIIDPQKDFHDTKIKDPKYSYEATLPVSGSTENAKEIAEMIKNNVTVVDEIYITLDTHHANHIGHASFWENKDKEKYKKWIDRNHYDENNERTYKGICREYIDSINKIKENEQTPDQKSKKIRYKLLLDGEKTKDQKIDLLLKRLDDYETKDMEDKYFKPVPTKSWWLDSLNKMIEGKNADDRKKIYQEQIKVIENERLQPDAFATIDCEMVRGEVWVPKDPSLFDYAIYYTSKLEEKKRFIHTIWPPHCLIGTEGHAVEDEISKACDFWTKVSLKPVKFVYKGMNLLTENFSAIEAEVPILSDPTTQKNTELLQNLRKNCNNLIIVGQARSHCVRYTIRDILKDWKKHVWHGEDRSRQIIIPTNGSSCVAPPDKIDLYEKGTKDFIEKIKQKSKGGCITHLSCNGVFDYIIEREKRN